MRGTRTAYRQHERTTDAPVCSSSGSTACGEGGAAAFSRKRGAARALDSCGSSRGAASEWSPRVSAISSEMAARACARPCTKRKRSSVERLVTTIELGVGVSLGSRLTMSAIAYTARVSLPKSEPE